MPLSWLWPARAVFSSGPSTLLPCLLGESWQPILPWPEGVAISGVVVVKSLDKFFVLTALPRTMGETDLRARWGAEIL